MSLVYSIYQDKAPGWGTITHSLDNRALVTRTLPPVTDAGDNAMTAAMTHSDSQRQLTETGISGPVPL